MTVIKFQVGKSKDFGRTILLYFHTDYLKITRLNNSMPVKFLVQDIMLRTVSVLKISLSFHFCFPNG